jgi:hypothetical protein
MTMGKWDGLAERIRQRIAELGYKNAAEFADRKHYRITYVYKWIAGTTPDRPTLEKLAQDLATTPEWLLFGDVVYERNKKRPKAIAGGSDIVKAVLLALGLLCATAPAAAAPLPIGGFADDGGGMRLIGSRRRRRWAQRLFSLRNPVHSWWPPSVQPVASLAA